MALPLEVTDPGSVNAADQGFGTGVASNVTPGSTVANRAQGVGVAADVDGDASMGNGQGAAVDVNQGDAVANQKQGTGVATLVDGGATGVIRGAPAEVSAATVVANQAPAGLGLPLDADGDASRGPNGTTRSISESIENDVVNQIYGNGRMPTNVNV